MGGIKCGTDYFSTSVHHAYIKYISENAPTSWVNICWKLLFSTYLVKTGWRPLIYSFWILPSAIQCPHFINKLTSSLQEVTTHTGHACSSRPFDWILTLLLLEVSVFALGLCRLYKMVNPKVSGPAARARTANGTALCHQVQLYRYFVSHSSEFCCHNPLCCFLTSVYCCCLFRYRFSPETFGYTYIQG